MTWLLLLAVPLAAACWGAYRYQPAPWCWCTHGPHPEGGCPQCGCLYFQAPFRRKP